VIFVDTGAWFALLVPEDRDHLAAGSWLGRNDQPLVTTDYVIDELLTLLRVRGEGRRALKVGELLFTEQLARIAWVLPMDVRQGWDYFRRYQDKGWSFTDCVSRVVIERPAIRQAFAFDRHFRHFGTLDVVP
jgi:predicted nucleic acid-binding protein